MVLGIYSVCCTSDPQAFFEQVSLELEYELGKALNLSAKIAFLEYEIRELQERKEECTVQSWNAYDVLKKSKEDSDRRRYEIRQRSSLETQWTLDVYNTKLKYLKMMQALDNANRKAKASGV